MESRWINGTLCLKLKGRWIRWKTEHSIQERVLVGSVFHFNLSDHCRFTQPAVVSAFDAPPVMSPEILPRTAHHELFQLSFTFYLSAYTLTNSLARVSFSTAFLTLSLLPSLSPYLPALSHPITPTPKARGREI